MNDTFLIHFQRGQMLLQRRRVQEAKQELLASLKDNPMFGPAHSLYALCLSEEPKEKENAIQAANKGIALDPEEAFPYYCLSVCLLTAHDYTGAERAIRKSIEIEPEDADYRCMLGSIALSQNRILEAKKEFESALALDADHEQSLALLAQVESRLGNTATASNLAKKVVQNTPESSEAHTAQGYSLIYAGRPQEAFEAFREALRLDPNNENARGGLVHSLKMNNFFFRNYFALCVKINQLSAQYQWVLIIGLFLAYRFINRLLIAQPVLAPVLVPLIVLYLAFCLFGWIADPLTSFLLLFSRWGRLATTFREKLTGLVFAGCVCFGLGGLIVSSIYPNPLLWFIALMVLVVTIPITFAIKTENIQHQLIYTAYASGMILLAVLGLITNKGIFIALVFLMLFVFQFIVNYINIRQTAPRFD